MPASVKGGIELRKALKKFTPDLAKETQKGIGLLLKPVTAKARGFIPATAPLTNWGIAPIDGKFPKWSTGDAKRNIGYKTTPSKPNRSGWRSLARIQNNSRVGAIYETAGRKNPQGSDRSRSKNPNAGAQFIDAINKYGELVDAKAFGNNGPRKPNFQGRAIFRAWKEDGGKTQGAVLKAIETSRDKFYAAVGNR